MDQNETNFELIIGKDKQIKVLYDLLKNRNYSISHKILPSYKTHEKFVLDNPYRCWYLVSFKKNYIGSFYLKKDNSVGININLQKKQILKSILYFLKNNYSPNKVLPSLVPPYFYINISSKNTDLQSFIEKLGGDLLQISYKL